MNWNWVCVAGFCYLAAAGLLFMMIADKRKTRAANNRDLKMDIAKSFIRSQVASRTRQGRQSDKASKASKDSAPLSNAEGKKALQR